MTGENGVLVGAADVFLEIITQPFLGFELYRAHPTE